MTTAHRVHMNEMTWTEYDARVRKDNPIVILPVGSLEQHGPHLPLFTDTLIPQMLSELIAPQVDAIVAPPLAFGYKSQPKSGGGQHFPGTTSLDSHTFTSTLRDVLMEMGRHGIRKICIIDGHLENAMFLVEGIDLGLRELRRDGIRDMKIVKIAYWEFVNKQTEDILFPVGPWSWPLEHGAVMETSLVMHFRPDLVRKELIPDHPPAQFPLYDVYPTDTRPIPPDGVMSSAKPASAAKGKAVVDQIVPDIVNALRTEFGA